MTIARALFLVDDPTASPQLRARDPGGRMATHYDAMARRADRVVESRGGRILANRPSPGDDARRGSVLPPH